MGKGGSLRRNNARWLSSDGVTPLAGLREGWVEALEAQGTPYTLHQAVALFRARHPQYATPEYAHTRSGEASRRFLRFVTESFPTSRKLITQLKIERIDTRRPPIKDAYYHVPQTNPYHVVVRVDDVIVDWTARKFRSDARYPFIWRREEAETAAAAGFDNYDGLEEKTRLDLVEDLARNLRLVHTLLPMYESRLPEGYAFGVRTTPGGFVGLTAFNRNGIYNVARWLPSRLCILEGDSGVAMIVPEELIRDEIAALLSAMVMEASTFDLLERSTLACALPSSGYYISFPEDVLPLGSAFSNIEISSTIRSAGGSPVLGTVVDPRSDKIPDVLYHVTTKADAVRASGYLKALGAGGLGGEKLDQVVSLTTDLAIATQLAKDLRFCIRMAKRFPEPRELLRDYPEDIIVGGPPGTYYAPFKKKVEAALAKEALANGFTYETEEGVREPEKLRPGLTMLLNSFFERRRKATISEEGEALHPPILYSTADVFVNAYEDDVAVIKVPRECLYTGALVAAFDTHLPEEFSRQGYGLKEVRVYGDVPLRPVTPKTAI